MDDLIKRKTALMVASNKDSDEWMHVFGGRPIESKEVAETVEQLRDLILAMTDAELKAQQDLLKIQWKAIGDAGFQDPANQLLAFDLERTCMLFNAESTLRELVRARASNK